MSVISLSVADNDAMERFGSLLGYRLSTPSVIFLRGDLGAGKTTLVRGLLSGRGWNSAVKSPTYTLVESYLIDGVDYHHFDLYRLHDPEELEYLGIRDYLSEKSICLFEWPDNGLGAIPMPDLEILIEYAGEGRMVSISGRLARNFTRLLENAI